MQVVVFDCETGGLDPGRHPIIQIAALACDLPEWREVGAFEAKVQFDLSACEPDALAINSYSEADWADALPWRVAAEGFSAFLGRHASVERTSRTGRPYTVAQGCAHNAPFDFDFLAAGFKREGMFLRMAFGPLCTLALARWLSLGSPRSPDDHRLGTLCKFYGIEHADAHDALGDVRATAALARRLVEHVQVAQ